MIPSAYEQQDASLRPSARLLATRPAPSFARKRSSSTAAPRRSDSSARSVVALRRMLGSASCGGTWPRTRAAATTVVARERTVMGADASPLSSTTRVKCSWMAAPACVATSSVAPLILLIVIFSAPLLQPASALLCACTRRGPLPRHSARTGTHTHVLFRTRTTTSPIPLVRTPLGTYSPARLKGMDR